MSPGPPERKRAPRLTGLSEADVAVVSQRHDPPGRTLPPRPAAGLSLVWRADGVVQMSVSSTRLPSIPAVLDRRFDQLEMEIRKRRQTNGQEPLPFFGS